VPATREALERAKLTLDDIDVVEFNEAFAGQVLACCTALGLAPDRVCPEGGALALGHPWGASGAVLIVRLFTQLVRRPRGRYGLAAIAVGGGQGVARVRPPRNDSSGRGGTGSVGWDRDCPASGWLVLRGRDVEHGVLGAALSVGPFFVWHRMVADGQF
jgi:hypothetical protein